MKWKPLVTHMRKAAQKRPDRRRTMAELAKGGTAPVDGAASR
jgi:hypothetical protein